MRSRLPAILLLGLVAMAGALTSPGPQASGASDYSTTIVDTGDYLDVDRGRQVSIVLDPAGRAVVSYIDYVSKDLKVLHCGDTACAAGNTITVPDTDNLTKGTSVALDAAGYPVVAYGQLKVLHCDAADCTGANTISEPDSYGTPASIRPGKSLAIDSAGRPVVSYREGTNGLSLLRCGDATCTSGNSITMPDPGVGEDNALVLDAAGFPVVAYYDADNKTLKVLHCGDATCTSGNSIVTADTDSGRHLSIALDGAGRPVVSYYDLSADELRVLRCGNPNCTSGNTIAVADSLPDLQLASGRTSLALDSADRPVISYEEPASQDLKLLRCGDATCTSGNTIATPDAAGDVGEYASLALDGSDNPVIAYYANDDLKLLICGNPTCEAGNTIVSPDTTPGIPTAGSAGESNSLVLDAAGYPVVSYDQGRILHCGNADCTAGNTIATPDTFGNGEHTSIALDSAGRPVVSYKGTTETEYNRLKVLRCGDPNCTSGAVISEFNSERVKSTSLVLDASDNPIVAYIRTDMVQNFEVKLLHCGDPTCTSGNSIVSLDASDDHRVSLKLDSAGNPIIAYPNGDRDLGIVRCGNPDCSAGNTFGVVEVPGNNVRSISMALDAAGNPVVALNAPVFSQGIAWFTTVVHCSDPACAGPASVTHPGGPTEGISVAIASNGNPVVSKGDLEVLFCGDADCSAGNTLVTFDDSLTYSNSYTSLALTDDDVPVVAYHHTSDEDLKVLSLPGPDTDLDGCTDKAENGLDPNVGGLRDHDYFWDFFDVWTHPAGDPIGWERNKVLNIFDINSVGARFGPGPVLSKAAALAQALVAPTDDSSYHPAFDRGPIIGANDWDRAPPDGSINIVDDILGVAQQFGHNCS